MWDEVQISWCIGGFQDRDFLIHYTVLLFKRPTISIIEEDKLIIYKFSLIKRKLISSFYILFSLYSLLGFIYTLLPYFYIWKANHSLEFKLRIKSWTLALVYL
jgi:hypothetical protein